MSEIYDAIVIGAGPAGLATSRELTQAGARHVVLERGDQAGQTWAGLYDSLVLHTTRGLSALPGSQFPSGTPRFAPRQTYLAHLHDYVRTFSLPVRTRQEVTGLHRESDLWRAQLASGQDVLAHQVVVATGIVSNPHVPNLPGRGAFGGRVMHSVEYRRPEPFKGQRVLVVGGGNSAADISVELARSGVDVTLSVRRWPRIVPLQVAGIPTQYAGFALARLPRAAHRLLEAMAARAAGRGRPAGTSVPQSDCVRVPVIGLELARALRSGAIALMGPVSDLTSTGARFGGGDTLPFDTVILATGYRAAVSFLGSAVDLDECGYPSRSNSVVSTDHPGLYFVGFNPDIRGGLYRIGRDATLAARCVRSRRHGTRRTPTERQRRRNGK